MLEVSEKFDSLGPDLRDFGLAMLCTTTTERLLDVATILAARPEHPRPLFDVEASLLRLLPCFFQFDKWELGVGLESGMQTSISRVSRKEQLPEAS